MSPEREDLVQALKRSGKVSREVIGFVELHRGSRFALVVGAEDAPAFNGDLECVRVRGGIKIELGGMRAVSTAGEPGHAAEALLWVPVPICGERSNVGVALGWMNASELTGLLDALPSISEVYATGERRTWILTLDDQSDEFLKLAGQRLRVLHPGEDVSPLQTVEEGWLRGFSLGTLAYAGLNGEEIAYVASLPGWTAIQFDRQLSALEA